MNRYKGHLSLSHLLSRVYLDLCVCEDNLKIQNEVLKDALEQVHDISKRLGDLLHDLPSHLDLESEVDNCVACPKCDHEFTDYVYVYEKVPVDQVIEFACLEELI